MTLSIYSCYYSVEVHAEVSLETWRKLDRLVKQGQDAVVDVSLDFLASLGWGTYQSQEFVQEFGDFHGTVQDLVGVGKSGDQLTRMQRAFRSGQMLASDAYGVWDALGSVSMSLTGPSVSGDQLRNAVRNAAVRKNLIRDGYADLDTLIAYDSGYGSIIDSANFVDDMGDTLSSSNGINYTLSPELLNLYQDGVNQIVDASTPLKNVYVFDVNNTRSFAGTRLDNNTSSSFDYYYGLYSLYRNICKDIFRRGHYAIGTYYDVSIDGNWVRKKGILELPDSPLDYIAYSSSSYSNGSGNANIMKKDNTDIEPILHVIENDNRIVQYVGRSSKYITFQYYPQPGIGSADYFSGYDIGYNLLNDNGRFVIFKSIGHATSSVTYGATVPDIIQPSYANQYWDQSQTINSNDMRTYNYNNVVNMLGDTSQYDDAELQRKIDEVFRELGESIEEGNHINEEGFSDNRDLLRKILDKLDDIYEKMGSGGSSIWDGVTDFIHWTDLSVKLDAIIALLGIQTVSDWVDDLTDKGADIVDIGTDIGEQLVLKFPFCIPWDIMAILNTLEALPETPVFEIPFQIPSWGIDTTFTLDLSEFETLSQISKWFFDVLYGIAITKLTLKILQVEFVGSSG